MNVSGTFTTLTFVPDSSSGFTVSGTGALVVNSIGSGSTPNVTVSNTGSNGVVTISAPFAVNTSGTVATRLLTILNNEADTAGSSLLINGGISAAGTNTWGLRYSGTGNTTISGALTGLTTIQQGFSLPAVGKLTIAGNQALSGATVNIAGS